MTTKQLLDKIDELDQDIESIKDKFMSFVQLPTLQPLLREACSDMSNCKDCPFGSLDHCPDDEWGKYD
jgi:hypothetical protein